MSDSDTVSCMTVVRVDGKMKDEDRVQIDAISSGFKINDHEIIYEPPK